MKIFLGIIFCALSLTSLYGQDKSDWVNYGRYAQTNKELEKKPRVVFMGNSITEGWANQRQSFFTDNNFAGRGISGQVTAQMLARFQSDVVALSPKVVVILAGTNDIAGNNGPVSIENISLNIVSMAQIAKQNGIKVVICSVLPAANYSWRPDMNDVPEKICELNGLLSVWARKNGCIYVDFWKEMEDGKGGLPKDLALDGVHPTPKGYDKMEEIIAPVLKKILK